MGSEKHLSICKRGWMETQLTASEFVSLLPDK